MSPLEQLSADLWRFLETAPDSELADEVEQLMDKCDRQLARQKEEGAQ